MKHERIILDNRSSKPLWMVYERAFDSYFDYHDDDSKYYAVESGDLVFYVKTNKRSITIQIYDNETHQ